MEIRVKTSARETKFTLNEKELAKSTILDLKRMLQEEIHVREERMKIHYKNSDLLQYLLIRNWVFSPLQINDNSTV